MHKLHLDIVNSQVEKKTDTTMSKKEKEKTNKLKKTLHRKLKTGTILLVFYLILF